MRRGCPHVFGGSEVHSLLLREGLLDPYLSLLASQTDTLIHLSYNKRRLHFPNVARRHYNDLNLFKVPQGRPSYCTAC